MADVITLFPRPDAPVQPIRGDLDTPPPFRRASFGLRSPDVAKGMKAAREDDEAAVIRAAVLGAVGDAKHAREHELQALSAKWEAAAFLLSQLARETQALNQGRAARTAFEMARLAEDVSAEVYPMDGGAA